LPASAPGNAGCQGAPVCKELRAGPTACRGRRPAFPGSARLPESDAGKFGNVAILKKRPSALGPRPAIKTPASERLSSAPCARRSREGLDCQNPMRGNLAMWQSWKRRRRPSALGQQSKPLHQKGFRRPPAPGVPGKRKIARIRCGEVWQCGNLEKEAFGSRP